MRKPKASIISLCIVSIMLISLSGCNKKQSINVAAGTGNDTLKEHYDISIGSWDIQNGFWEPQKDEFLQKIQKDFNITIKPVQVSWTNYKEKYQIMAASGQLPDVFANTIINTNIYDEWIKEGIIKSLPENLSKYPNVEKIMGLPDVKDLKVDGKYYMIPRTSFEDRDLYASNSALLVRKDWMNELGIKDPQNFEEFKLMLKAFAKNDPDGNGKNDTVGLTFNNRDALGKWIMLNIYPQFNIYSWVKEGDKYIPTCAAKDFPKALKKLRELYDEDAIDKDFSIENAGDGTVKFAQGKTGALEHMSSPGALLLLSNMWDKYNPGKKFTDYVKILHVFPAEDGNLYYNTNTVFWSESYFNSSISDGKMDRILKLYDYLLSNEGRMAFKLGIEGKDYKKDGDKIIITRPKDEKTNEFVDISTLYPSIPNLFERLASWGGSREDFRINEVNKTMYTEDILKMSHEEIEWNLQNTRPVSRPYPVLTMSTPAKAQFDSISIVDDVTRVIIGEDDPEVMWQKVLKEYSKKGLNEAIKEVNEKVKELGIE